MMERRPIYETRHSRDVESAIAARVALSLMQSVRRMNPMYPVDYAVVCDAGMKLPAITGLLECKARSYTFAELDAMGGIILSLHKWLFCKRVTTELRVPFHFAVQDSDNDLRVACWGMHVGADAPAWPFYRAYWGGRLDRNDPVDLEPVIMIPVEAFSAIR